MKRTTIYLPTEEAKILEQAAKVDYRSCANILRWGGLEKAKEIIENHEKLKRIL
jgi:hypothetical protein